MAKLVNEIGNKYNRLIVIKRGPNIGTAATWICKCDCGNITQPVMGQNLRKGDTQSCGCLLKEKAGEICRKRNSKKGHIEKVRDFHLGRKRSKETCLKISSKRIGKYKGDNNSFYGKKHNDETRRKMSLNHKDMRGENNPNWKGGITNELYCDAWADKEYKQSILERDAFQCQNSDCWKTSNILVIHHVDYNKKNCCPKNLITLCNSCNTRANFNREIWQEFYGEIQLLRIEVDNLKARLN